MGPDLLNKSEKYIDHLWSKIDDLIDLGYRDNSEEICSFMHGLLIKDALWHYYFSKVAEEPRILKMVGAQSYLLHSGKHFLARLNFWPPKSDGLTTVYSELKQYYSIDVLHNHSFDFFTIGVLGPGYKTIFYDTLDDLGKIEVGSSVTLREIERFTLSKKSVKFVPKSSIFHMQLEPERLSASLNIIPTRLDKVGSSDNAQLILDIDSHKVTEKIMP